MSLNGEYQFTMDQVAQNRKAARREAAKARQAKSDALTPQQRLANLDQALGVGQGARKERAKLAARIANPKKAEAAKVAPTTHVKHDAAGKQIPRKTSSKDKRQAKTDQALNDIKFPAFAPEI